MKNKTEDCMDCVRCDTKNKCEDSHTLIIETLVKLVAAVSVTNYEGIQCHDVDGKNWFDVRDNLLGI